MSAEEVVSLLNAAIPGGNLTPPPAPGEEIDKHVASIYRRLDVLEHTLFGHRRG